MGAILLALLNGAFSFLLRTVIVKFFVFGVVWVVTTLFLVELVKYLPDFSGGLTSVFSSTTFTPLMWFMFDSLSFSTGFPLLLSAYLARFAIRRIPFIG